VPTRNHESHSASTEAVHRDGSGEIAPESWRDAINRIADRLGVHPEALRNGVRQAEIDGGFRSGTTTGDADRIAQQEREAAAPADSSLSTRQLPHDKILNASPDVQPHYAATEYAGLPLTGVELPISRTRLLRKLLPPRSSAGRTRPGHSRSHPGRHTRPRKLAATFLVPHALTAGQPSPRSLSAPRLPTSPSAINRLARIPIRGRPERLTPVEPPRPQHAPSAKTAPSLGLHPYNRKWCRPKGESTVSELPGVIDSPTRSGPVPLDVTRMTITG